jgi:ADP-ribosylglycohydrolase
MLGAITGDILGSIHEYNPIKIKNFELLNPKCVYTDDTIMTVAVADSLMNRIPYIESLQTWGNNYPSAGYGGWFNEWIHSEFPKPYNSYGNGSAMRCSSIGWLYDDEDSVLNEAKKSAEITHNHPEGIKGAQAVALGVMMGRLGSTKLEIQEELESLFEYDLSQTLRQIRRNYSHDVTCQGSVPQAIIAFLESEDFEDAIRNAISLGGDADTQACIAGALAEAYYMNIPEQIKQFVLKRITPDILEILHQLEVRTKIVLN